MSENKMQENRSGGQSFPTSVTSVHVYPVTSRGNTLANASVDINGVLAIRGIRVVQGKDGPFVSMPQRKVKDEYQDVCFPTTKEFRQELHSAVLNAYQMQMDQARQQAAQTSDAMTMQ